MQPEWTSVDVAPPENMVSVTVWLLSHDHRLVSRPLVGYRSGDAWYVEGEESDNPLGNAYSVTHWMPLPDPPEDGHLDPHQADIQ